MLLLTNSWGLLARGCRGKRGEVGPGGQVELPEMESVTRRLSEDF